VHLHFVTSPIVREKCLPKVFSPLLETCLLHSLFEPNVRSNWDLAQLQQVIVPFLWHRCHLTSPLQSLVSVLPAKRALRQAYSRLGKTKSACKASTSVKTPRPTNLRQKGGTTMPYRYADFYAARPPSALGPSGSRESRRWALIGHDH
jgi:hypothetical protein